MDQNILYERTNHHHIMFFWTHCRTTICHPSLSTCVCGKRLDWTHSEARWLILVTKTKHTMASPQPAAMINNDSSVSTDEEADAAVSSYKNDNSVAPIVVGDHDVLLGRGKATHIHTGNVRFRELVKERATVYRNNTDTAFRRSVAQDILDTVHANGGRFLKSIQVSTTSSSTSRNQQWQIVEQEKVMTKVKQCLRDTASSMTLAEDMTPPPARQAPTRTSSSITNNLFARHPQAPPPLVPSNSFLTTPVMPGSSHMLYHHPLLQPQPHILPQPHYPMVDPATLVRLQQHSLQAHRLQQLLAAEEQERQQLTAATILLLAHNSTNNNAHQQLSSLPLGTTNTRDNDMQQQQQQQQIRHQLLLLTQLGLLPAAAAQPSHQPPVFASSPVASSIVAAAPMVAASSSSSSSTKNGRRAEEDSSENRKQP